MFEVTAYWIESEKGITEGDGRFTVYAVNGDKFLIYACGEWVWMPMNRFVPVK